MRPWLAPLVLLLVGLDFLRRGLSAILSGGASDLYGAPLLGLGIAAAGTGAALLLPDALARRRMATWMCLAGAVPLLAVVLMMRRLPDHGSLGAMFNVPLLGGAALLALASVAMSRPTGRLASALLGSWLGSVLVLFFVSLGGAESGMSVFKDAPELALLFTGLGPPMYALIFIEGAFSGHGGSAWAALLLCGSIVAGGLLGVRIHAIGSVILRRQPRARPREGTGVDAALVRASEGKAAASVVVAISRNCSRFAHPLWLVLFAVWFTAITGLAFTDWWRRIPSSFMYWVAAACDRQEADVPGDGAGTRSTVFEMAGEACAEAREAANQSRQRFVYAAWITGLLGIALPIAILLGSRAVACAIRGPRASS